MGDRLPTNEQNLLEPLSKKYLSIIRLARTLSQLEEFTENQLVNNGITSYQELEEQKEFVQTRLSSLLQTNGIEISERRLARFDQKTNSIVFGHLSNPERQKSSLETIPAKGQGFFINLVNHTNGENILLFDFDNPKEHPFLWHNIPGLRNAMEQKRIPNLPTTKIHITMAMQPVFQK